MPPRFLRRLLPFAVLALAPACGTREAAADLDLVTTACAGTPPLPGVTHLRFRVSGPDMDSVERVSTVNWSPEDVPEVPAGKARVLEVRGFTENPDLGAPVVALGRSVPFDVPEEGTGPVPVRVFLRRVGEPVPVNSAAQPDACALPLETRAGHTATALPDGRVLLAGGFQSDRGGVSRVLSSSELFDPVAGTFSSGPDVGARAFHTATALPDGRVLLAGGTSTTAPTDSVQVLDVAAGTASGLTLRVARTGHVAASDAQGHVLLVGGRRENGAMAEIAEGFDAASGRMFDVFTPVLRLDAAMTVLPDGRTLVVAGGSDGVMPRTDVVEFTFGGNTFVPVVAEPKWLKAFHVSGTVAWLGRALSDGPRPLVMGGFSTVTPETAEPPVAVSEFLESDEWGLHGVSVGPNLVPRANACAVSLPDGRVLVIGGRSNERGSPRAVAQVESVAPSPSPMSGVLGLPALPQPRWQHTCTVLADGSVLVVGGVDDSEGDTRFPGEALVIMPPPRD